MLPTQKNSDSAPNTVKYEGTPFSTSPLRKEFASSHFVASTTRGESDALMRISIGRPGSEMKTSPTRPITPSVRPPR